MLNKKKKLILAIAGIMAMSTPMLSNAQGTVKTIEGYNRVETSIKTALEQNTKVDYLILANGYSFADSLSSVNLLNKYPNSKLILVSPKTNISNELKKIKPKKVLLVGGSDTISDNFVNQAKKLGIETERFSGVDRYKTNEKTLDGFNKVGVADGRNYPDALSASALLKQENLGLMLVNGSKFYNTEKEVKYTFGDKDSVKQDNGERLSGLTRYETNEKINDKLSNKDNIITYGGNYADALSSVNLLNGNNKIILLNNNYISNKNKSLIKEGSNIIVGGLLKNITPTINNISNDNKSIEDKNKPTATIDKKYSKLPSFAFNGPIKTQKDLDKYILSRFVEGIEEDGETVELANDKIEGISQGLDCLIEDTGFKLEGDKEGNKYKYYLKPSFFMAKYIGNEYNKTDFVNNLNQVRDDILKSHAMDYKTRYEKYESFSIHVKRIYPFKSVASNLYREESSVPYSLYWHKSASCVGYSYYNNFAAILMKIPSYMVVGDSGTPGNYHAENVFLDERGETHQFNTTGLSPFYPDLPDDILIETLVPTVKNFYYPYNNGQIKKTDYLPKRQSSITKDFYN